MSKVLPQTFELVDLHKLKQHPKNPRRGDVGKIAESIAENGFYRPVVVQKSTGYILAGNHSWEAAQREGLEKIPVVYLAVDNKAALKILLADNKSNDVSGYDAELLASILMEARTQGSLDGTGYSDLDLAEVLKGMSDAMFATAGEAVAETKLPGDADAKETPAKGESKLSGGFAYRVVVDCESEAHQAELLERFEADGLKVRPLIS